MVRGLFGSVAAAFLVLVAGSPAHAQTSASLTGVVSDTTGAVVPGAAVSVTSIATKVTLDGVTNSAGYFSFPSLPVGTYRVTVGLIGFKTFVADDVRVLGAQTTDVVVTLVVGAITEKIDVRSHNELIQTQSATVTSTLQGEQLRELPLSSRNALHAVMLLPGVSTTRSPKEALINGLSSEAVTITIDGVATTSSYSPADGLVSMVTPRLDAVEEMTVTGAVPGSGTGRGSVQVAFTTRSGSNRTDGSVYHYWRDPRLNSNYFFNRINKLPRNKVILQQYGVSQGGPIVIPGLYNGRGKAFFFFNFENQHQPTSVNRTRNLLRPEAQAGVFGYNVTVAGVQQRRTVDLVALASANGQLSAFDPTVVGLLADIRRSTMTSGRITDTGAANLLQYIYQSEATSDQYSPTTRLDFNLSENHHLSGAYWWQQFKSTSDLARNTDAAWPGLPNYGSPNWYRTSASVTLRSTLGRALVNSVVGGWQWSPNDSYSNVTRDQFANQEGYGLIFPISTSPTVVTSLSPLNITTWSLENTLTWLRGAHSMSIGAGYAGFLNRETSEVIVPSVTLGFDANLDPARGMFNTINFPSATATQLNEARALYALLTGRVSSLPGLAHVDSATGKYVFNGDLDRRFSQNSFSAWVQDSWRVKPTVTVTGGVRWDLQLPFAPADNSWSIATIEDVCGVSGVGNGVGGRGCNFFTPGSTSGQLIPTFDLLEPGRPTYKTEWTDFAPHFGVAWRPNVERGWIRRLLGDPDQATLRAGYAMSFDPGRRSALSATLWNNPGRTIDASRNNTFGYPLVGAGETHPVLFSERPRLGPPPFPDQPGYPTQYSGEAYISYFPANLKTPRVHSYSIGIQRSVGRDMAIEVRYVGNRNVNLWREEDWNEFTIFENGFLDEFRAAQRNIAINSAAGLHTFAFTGLIGTAPLPIHLAYLTGRTDADNPAAYATSTAFSDEEFIVRLSPRNPAPYEAVGAFDVSEFRANALAAGLPLNFLVLNPTAAFGVSVMQDKDWTKYNSLQLELRRRFAQGLSLGANYTYGLRSVSLFETLRKPRIEVASFNPRNVPHMFKMHWTWEVPVGRGRRYGGTMHPVFDALVGNWQYSGTARMESVRYDVLGVKLEGMTLDELQKEFRIRVEKNAAGATQFFSFPEDIRRNTAAAFSVDPTTPTGYSLALGAPTGRYMRPVSDPTCMAIFWNDCSAPEIALSGPVFSRWDMRLNKRFPVGRRVSIELTLEVLNVFDTINFNHSVARSTDPASAFRVGSAYTEINTTLDPGGRIGQLAWRINW